MKEASFYSVFDKKKSIICCDLCPRSCKISDGKTGFCGTRKNIEGKLYSLTYGKISSVNIDPIEKKPLYNFHPGKEILSIGSVGCNFSCPWCQNSGISRAPAEETELRDTTSEQLIAFAKTYNSIGIAYTYNEPLINFEFVRDCAIEAHKYQLKNVLVSNGYICEKALTELLPLIDAANIDIKFFRQDYYKTYCGGNLGDVMRSIQMFVQNKKHIELTLCVIPPLNDGEDNFKELVDWIWALSPDIPLHISRYFPSEGYGSAPTTVKTLHKLRNIAIKKLNFVYLGNVSEETGTYCPSCKTQVIHRKGYNIELGSLDGNSCTNCGEILPIIF